jgi:UDP-GlcNAc:undecaprenyl-phosphate GlcNAc-1-phosphate transferase
VLLGWFVAGAGAAVLVWALLKDAFGAPVFTRVNVAGRPVPTGSGVVIMVGALAVEGVARLGDAGGIDLPSGTSRGRYLAVLLGLGMALLGLLDDLGGVGESGGFRGHLLALRRGRLTTGAVKLFGGAALAITVVSVIEPGAFGRLLADSALVALAANLANLLDRAPGRVTKSGLVAFGVLLVATGMSHELAGVAVIVGGAAGLLWPDLRERLMLGDAGANALGAVLGLGVVVACAPDTRTVLLIVVIALNLLSEVVSFSRVIERVPPLRMLDRLGRRT